MKINASKNRTIAYTGAFAALTFVFVYFFHIPMGGHGGYIHVGDAIVYLSAAILPLPYAMAASAIGAGLSDLLSPGGAVWILPTVIIKPLCCLPFARNRGQLLNRRNLVAIVVAGAITIVGYSIALGVMTGNFAAAFLEMGAMDLVQSAGSGIAFLVLAAALEKGRILDRITV